MEEKISPPVYVLVVKKENLEQLRLYLDNLKSLGLYFENVPGTTVDAIFIKVSISELAMQHFSELYEIGTEKQSNCSYIMLEPILLSPFSTPISVLPPRQDGQLFNSEMVMIIHKILEHTKFSHKDNDRGMSKLIRHGILLDGYPLHDGPATENGYNERSLLLRYWSNVSSVHREQPLDLVQRYFGHEIAFYFAWLEYFNFMLILPSILGAAVFITSLLRVNFFHVMELEEICNDEGRYVCPTCEYRANCKFTKLSEFCSMSHWTYVFDNPFTIGFAVFMSFWATLFLTIWHRKENKLKLRWNANIEVDDVEAKMRGVFREKTKYRQYNPNTGEVEPYVPRMRNIFNYGVSFFSCAVVIGIMLLSVTLNITTGIEFRSFVDRYGNAYLKTNKIIFSMMLGSFIQVMYIKLMSLIFGPLSIKLTNLENPPTQHDYDNSVLYKRYVLAFVNNLSPLFYLAFIKGKLYTVPHKNNFYLAKDLCQPQNCIVALCIQLTFLLTLRSFAGNVANLIIPQIKWVYRMVFKIKKEATVQELPQWEEEYFMQPSGRYLLTSEYSEMIIKYCLVTFFVGAFPLAPMCALINNLLELRSDAYKLVKNHRRPIPMRKSSIGAWNGILLSMTYVSTATNAFVIAFTSDFIPVQIYRHVGEIKSFYGYILSKFATKDYTPFTKLDNAVDYCWYRGHFNPPDSPDAYRRDTYYWLNLSAKFIGILVFEHIVLICNSIMSYFIPKQPDSVEKQLLLEKVEKKDEIIKSIDLKREKKTRSVKEILKIRL